MTTLHEAAQQALEKAFELSVMHHTDDGYSELRAKVRELSRQALEGQSSKDAEDAAQTDSLRSDALRTLSYCAGLKAGWNFCMSDDDVGFERAQSQATEALRALKAAPQPARQPLTDELAILRAISDEYNAWIRYHAGGGSYDSFLESRQAAHGIHGGPHA